MLGISFNGISALSAFNLGYVQIIDATIIMAYLFICLTTGFRKAKQVLDLNASILRGDRLSLSKLMLMLGIHINKIWRSIRSFKLSKIIDFSIQGTQICHPQYYQFGLLGLLYCIYPLLGLVIPLLGQVSYAHTPVDIIGSTIRGIGAIGCIVLLSSGAWKGEKAERYMPFIWHIILLWCLPLFSTYNFLIHSNHLLAIYSIGASFILATYVDARSFVVLMGMGMLGGYLLHALSVSLFPSMISPDDEMINWGVGIYVVLVITLTTIMRRNQEHEVRTLKIFGSAIAHEVKAPMAAAYSAINMMVEALDHAEMAQKLTPTQLAKLQKQGKRALIMDEADYEFVQYIKGNIANVLERGIQSSQTILAALSGVHNAEDFGQYSVMTAIVEAVKYYPLKEQDRARVHIDTNADFMFDGSYSLLQHVIQNLLSNAVRYAGRNAQIYIWVEQQAIHFKDTGKGIPPEQLQHIFDLYYTKESGGSGIGLPFCKSALASMGGKITCRSELNYGTEFIIILKEAKNT